MEPRTEAAVDLDWYLRGVLAAFIEQGDPRLTTILLDIRNRLAAIEAEAALPVPHRHRYALVPVWKKDRSAVESWWWCTDHPAGEWVKQEDDADARDAIPALPVPALDALRGLVSALNRESISNTMTKQAYRKHVLRRLDDFIGGEGAAQSAPSGATVIGPTAGRVPTLAAALPVPAPSEQMVTCAICGDYSAKGVEVHEVCLEMLSKVASGVPALDALRAALKALLHDFDRTPTDEYLDEVAVPMVRRLAALPVPAPSDGGWESYKDAFPAGKNISEGLPVPALDAHEQDIGPMRAWCRTCGKRWPCEVALALPVPALDDEEGLCNCASLALPAGIGHAADCPVFLAAVRREAALPVPAPSDNGEHVDVVEIGEAATSALDEFDNIRWDDLWEAAGGSPDLVEWTQKYVGYVRADIERVIAALTQGAAAPAAVPALDALRLALAMHPVWFEEVSERPSVMTDHEWGQMLLDMSLRRTQALAEAQTVLNRLAVSQEDVT